MPIGPINIFDALQFFAITGLFSSGKAILNREEVVSALHRGLEDLSNADTRTLGMQYMPNITLETAETAAKILETLDPEDTDE